MIPGRKLDIVGAFEKSFIDICLTFFNMLKKLTEIIKNTEKCAETSYLNVRVLNNAKMAEPISSKI